MKSTSAVLVVLGLVGATSVSAEDYPLPRPCHGYAVYHHASTVEEGLARGVADIIRSAGEGNLLHSEAAKNWEQARRLNLENRVYQTQAYFDMQRLNQEARQVQRGPRPTQEDLARYARMRAPQRLNATEFDPSTGQIQWPLVLREAPYAAGREALEVVCEVSARRGYLDSSSRGTVQLAVDRLQQQLAQNIHVYPPQDYVQAKQFINRLGLELQAGPRVETPLATATASRDAARAAR